MNKTTKRLIGVSLLIFGLGISIPNIINALINETDGVIALASILGMVTIKIVAICISLSIIAFIWLMYGAILIVKEYRKKE